MLKSILGTVLLLAACISPSVQAADVVLTWTAPSLNTDGSTLPKIGGYNVYRGTTAALKTAADCGPPPIAGGAGNGVTAPTYTDKGLIPGTYYYGVSTWACQPTCQEGPLSAVIAVTVLPPIMNVSPSAPTSLSATCAVSSAGACTVTVVGK